LHRRFDQISLGGYVLAGQEPYHQLRSQDCGDDMPLCGASAGVISPAQPRTAWP